MTEHAAVPGRGCLFSDSPLRHVFVDLARWPLCESYVPHEKLDHVEPFRPRHVYVCEYGVRLHGRKFVAPIGELRAFD